MLSESHPDAPRRARSMPADARAELQRLFKAYDSACLDLDAEAVAALYDLPCLISAPAGNAAFTARADLRQMLAGRFADYRRNGIVSASLTALDLESVAADFAVARVVWSLSDRRDLDVASVPRRYTLRRSDTIPGRPWRIAHVVSLGDPTARRQRAVLPHLSLARG
ncbi:MAG: hypothetical protein JNL25_09785 [Rhodospirillaceae bacterium]|nr:hypothetical protein [Rhodospirillaceae bacterium]